MFEAHVFLCSFAVLSAAYFVAYDLPAVHFAERLRIELNERDYAFGRQSRHQK